MVQEIRYTNIRRVLDNLHAHPMLSDLTLEQAVRHTIRFISLHGYYKLYEEKQGTVDIHEFRGLLPCDLISIIQVRDMASGRCLRSMTDNFTEGMRTPEGRPCKDPMNNVRDLYIPPLKKPHGDITFKTQGRVIFTSFPEGKVEIAYQGIPVDEDGFPLLVDNEIYLGALEAYIKKQVFTVKFDQGKITAGVLQNAQTDYAVLATELQSEFTTPSVSEMQTIANLWSTMIPQMRHFDNGFKDMGTREYLRRQ